MTRSSCYSFLALSVFASMSFLPSVQGQDPDKKSNASWTELFEKESWFKSAPGKIQTFAGKLEATSRSDRPSPSTLQRTTYYKLGDRTIYTGAKIVPALEKLIAKKVEIRGKAVDMQLEGQSLKEIWPAAIRVAPAK